MPQRSRIALLFGVLAVAGTQPAHARSGGLPDLVEARVNVSDHSVAAGQNVEVTDVVANRGDARAGRSVTNYFIEDYSPCRSAEPPCLKPDWGAGLGTRSAPPLRRERRSTGRRVVRIPGSLPPGPYQVFACADMGNAVRESDEGNNCRAARHLVHVRPSSDRTAPHFAGLESATTCIPGPVGGDRETSYTLKWKAATDDVTPQNRIVYDVYQATQPGGEDFSHPTYTTAAGATSYKTPQLSANKAYYFVVRARDEAGNSDSNRVERQGENLCV